MATLSPFKVDPDVRARIHPMRPRDVPDVVRLHAAAMGHSLWSRLGQPFLQQVYTGLLAHRDFIGYVYVEDGRVRGFIAGTADGPRMLTEVGQGNAVQLSLATLRGLLADPGAVRPLVETFRYFGKSSAGEQEIRAESMFCSFERYLRGKRVSGLINKVFFDELAARGHRHVKITTEHDNQGAIRQLTSWGFEDVGRFRFYGKEMIIWRLDLVGCERVELPDKKTGA